MRRPSAHSATSLQGEHQTAPGTEVLAGRENRRESKAHGLRSIALASPASLEFSDPTDAACRAASSAIEDAAALIRAVRSDRRLSQASALLSANRRDPKVKKIRAQLFAAASDVLVQLYRGLLSQDAGDVLRLAARRQQPSSLFLPTSTPRSPIEEAISAISDLLAETKDPCHPSKKGERQLGIFRRPYDAMPLFFPNGRLRTDGTFFPDVDRLAWEWLPLTLFTLSTVDGEEYEEATPATDAAGNVEARSFFLWRGSALSTAYKLGERKVATAKGREIKKHASVPGLHEIDGQLFVHMPKYLSERVERKATHWSQAAAGLSRAIAGNSGLLVLGSARPTRTEKFLLQLDSEGANAALLREEWSEQIEEERRLGVYD